MARSAAHRVVEKRRRSYIGWLGPLAAAVVMALTLAACVGSDAAPAAPDGDAFLDQGRTLWINNCANCHGAAGGGGIGPKLSENRVIERFPVPADHLAVVRDGKGRMPAFSGRFDEAELDAVVAYTREVLAVG